MATNDKFTMKEDGITYVAVKSEGPNRRVTPLAWSASIGRRAPGPTDGRTVPYSVRAAAHKHFRLKKINKPGRFKTKVVKPSVKARVTKTKSASKAASSSPVTASVAAASA